MTALLASIVLAALALAYLQWPLWLALPAGLVAYVVQSIYRPYARCWRCKGKPRFTSSSGRTWRDCWFCGGSGKRRRLGRKWFDNAMSRKQA